MRNIGGNISTGGDGCNPCGEEHRLCSAMNCFTMVCTRVQMVESGTMGCILCYENTSLVHWHSWEAGQNPTFTWAWSLSSTCTSICKTRSNFHKNVMCQEQFVHAMSTLKRGVIFQWPFCTKKIMASCQQNSGRCPLKSPIISSNHKFNIFKFWQSMILCFWPFCTDMTFLYFIWNFLKITFWEQVRTSQIQFFKKKKNPIGICIQGGNPG